MDFSYCMVNLLITYIGSGHHDPFPFSLKVKCHIEQAGILVFRNLSTSYLFDWPILAHKSFASCSQAFWILSLQA